tara:strand:+ start:118 stop:870 length:753 start_codon:yes stop_codon:yes gene_type:complete
MLGLRCGLSSSSSSSSALAGEFTLDQAGTMVAWYKFDEGQSKADSDGDGTEEVSSWSSSFGTANALAQSTATKQPAYNSGHLDFHQPSQQKLEASADFGGAGLASFTIMISISPDNFTGSRTVFGRSTTAGNLFRFSSNNTTTRLQFQGAAFDSVASEAYPTSRFILTITRDTSSNPNPIKIYNNTTEVVSGTKTFGSQSAAALFNQIGCQAGASNPFDGQISEIAIWSDVLTDADRAAAIADMQVRTGV